MQPNHAAFRVGMFVLAGIIVVIALIFFLSGAVLHPGIVEESYFQESVQGLDVGTAVKFRGVNIGQVTEIALVSAEYPPPNPADQVEKVYQQIVVRFRVNPKKLGHIESIDKLVAHGLRTQIEPQGITGLAYLDISFVDPKKYPLTPVPWTPDNPVIPSIPSTLTQISDALQNVMSSLSHVDAGKMIAQVSGLMNTLSQEFTTGDAHQALGNANLLLKNVNTILAQTELPQTSAAIRNLAQGKQMEQIIAELNNTMAQLSKASSQLPALVASSQAAINQANETTADLQAQLGPILQDLKTTTANLRALSSSLARNPSQVILGAPPPPEGDR